MLDKTINYQAIAIAIRNNLFEGSIDKNIEFTKRIFEKCNKIYPNETLIDKVFKTFVTCKTSTNTYKFLSSKGYKITNDQISDTIFYRQCSDIEITLIAKEMYYTQHKTDLLKHQINVILQNGSIDIYKEIIRHYQNKYGSEYSEHMAYTDESFYYEIK